MAYAIDLFCGAGGMSEGLLQAGFKVLFASDINAMAMQTYTNRHNQLGYKDGVSVHHHTGDIAELTGNFIMEKIGNLEIFSNAKMGKTSQKPEIDAIFGGPPCQGFSRAGKRNENDPRNQLFKEYIRVIGEIRPKYVVMENVVGFLDTKFNGTPVKDILFDGFTKIGYNVLNPQILNAADFGVAQRRNRVIFMAHRKDVPPPQFPKPTTALPVPACRQARRQAGENAEKITIEQAIGDLQKFDNYENGENFEFLGNSAYQLSAINGENLGNCELAKMGENRENCEKSAYQLAAINGRTPNINGLPISSGGKIYNHEMPKHQPIITERFSLFREGESGSDLKNRLLADGVDLSQKPHLLAHCAKSLKMSTEETLKLFAENINQQMLDILLTKKNMRTKLDKNAVSPTVLTIADDYIIPFANRTLTVRESARLQSFDDSFIFLGKRTTGGLRRRVETPQYTQVGNAVPPLLARAIAAECLRVLG